MNEQPPIDQGYASLKKSKVFRFGGGFLVFCFLFMWLGTTVLFLVQGLEGTTYSGVVTSSDRVGFAPNNVNARGTCAYNVNIQTPEKNEQIRVTEENSRCVYGVGEAMQVTVVYNEDGTLRSARFGNKTQQFVIAAIVFTVYLSVAVAAVQQYRSWSRSKEAAPLSPTPVV